MDSFYGGKQGLSFILKRSFSSIKEMKDCFKQGAEYKDVWYNEYCIIDTKNKNDKDNGKIFRRGFTDLNENGNWGAQQVGQIVGPQSGMPLCEFDSIENVKDKIGEINPKTHICDYLQRQELEDGTVQYVPVQTTSASNMGEIKNQLAILPGDVDGQSRMLVPGKDEDGNYRDDVQWTWCNVRNNDNSESWFYLGFEFPYLVQDFTTTTTEQYFSQEIIEKLEKENNIIKTWNEDHPNKLPHPAKIIGALNTFNSDSADIQCKINDPSHPFYKSWEIAIPKGIKGDTFQNLQVYNKAEIENEESPLHNNIYDSTGALYEFENDVKKDDSIQQILVYEYYNYDERKDPKPKYLYLGDFNIIDDITFIDGILSISFTHKKHKDFTLEYVTNIEIDTSVVEENQEDLGSSGNLTLTYSTKDGDKYKTTTIPNHIQYLADIEIPDPDKGIIIKKYVGRIAEKQQLKWPIKITVNNEGYVTIDYTTGEQETVQLNWPTHLTHDDHGNITVEYTKDNDDIWSKVLKNIQSVSMPINQGDKNKYLQTSNQFTIKYNTLNDDGTNETETIGEPVNYIEKAIVDPINFHLYILYRDPQSRVAEDTDGWVKTDQINDATLTIDYQNLYWQDMGAVKSPSGILIAKNIKAEEIRQELGISTGPSKQQVIQYLNTVYPEGLDKNNAALLGSHVVTVDNYESDKEDKDKAFYAYDYSFDEEGKPKKWFYLGTIAGDTGLRHIQLNTKSYDYGIEKIDKERDALLENLVGNGLLLEQTTFYNKEYKKLSAWNPEPQSQI